MTTSYIVEKRYGILVGRSSVGQGASGLRMMERSGRVTKPDCLMTLGEITSGNLRVVMKEQINQSPEKIKLEESQLRQLSSEEKQTLLAALNTARETVKPTVKRLMESESVSNDILTMRLDNAAVRRSTGACNAI